MRSFSRAAAVGAAAFYISAGSADAGEIDASLRHRLAQGPSDARHKVIVRLKPHVSAEQEADAVSTRGKAGIAAKRIREAFAERVTDLTARLGDHRARGKAADIFPLWIADAVALTADVDVIHELAGRADVQSVVDDAVIPLSGPAASYGYVPWDNIGRTGAPLLWQEGVTGRGVVVASLDSGVDVRHPILSTTWRGGTNSWFDPYDRTTRPFDTDGHGTAVMSIIAGGIATGSYGGTMITGRPVGMAPDVKWISARIFHPVASDDETEMVAETSKIHAAFQWLLDPDGNPETDDAPDIVNNSWDLEADHYPLWNQEFRKDVQVLKSAGIAVVFAAGNDGDDDNTSTSPANYPESFAAGGTTRSDGVSAFSSRGPTAAPKASDPTFPQIVAPGEDVFAAMPTSFSSVWAMMDGTSFAAPHVSGAMALLLSARPEMTPQELEDALKTTAVPVTERCPNNRYGYGFIAVDEAARKLGILGKWAATGDVDGDGAVNARDALAALRGFILPPAVVAESKALRQKADVAPEGGDLRLTLLDVVAVLRKWLGIRLD